MFCWNWLESWDIALDSVMFPLKTPIGLGPPSLRTSASLTHHHFFFFCAGSESSIEECSSSPWGTAKCFSEKVSARGIDDVIGQRCCKLAYLFVYFLRFYTGGQCLQSSFKSRSFHWLMKPFYVPVFKPVPSSVQTNAGVLMRCLSHNAHCTMHIAQCILHNAHRIIRIRILNLLFLKVCNFLHSPFPVGGGALRCFGVCSNDRRADDMQQQQRRLQPRLQRRTRWCHLHLSHSKCTFFT